MPGKAPGISPLRISRDHPAPPGTTVGGGRLGGLKLVGIVIGGLVETPSSRCAEPFGTPAGPHP